MSSIIASQHRAQAHEILAESFAKLALSKNPSKKSKSKYRKARSKFIAAEFEDFFGSDAKLENWQRLCDDLGLQGDLTSITKCRKVCLHCTTWDFTKSRLIGINQMLGGIWVNIWNFLDAKRIGTQVKRFSSQRLLGEYSIENYLIFLKM